MTSADPRGERSTRTVAEQNAPAERRFTVGLTGGIGSGKSEVLRRFAAHGATVVDADLAARLVVEPGTDGYEEVVKEFGEGALGCVAQ